MYTPRLAQHSPKSFSADFLWHLDYKIKKKIKGYIYNRLPLALLVSIKFKTVLENFSYQEPKIGF